MNPGHGYAAQERRARWRATVGGECERLEGKQKGGELEGSDGKEAMRWAWKDLQVKGLRQTIWWIEEVGVRLSMLYVGVRRGRGGSSGEKGTERVERRSRVEYTGAGGMSAGLEARSRIKLKGGLA